MSPSMGRPKVENPKGINLTIRLDPDTDKRLFEYCKKNDVSRGEAVRQGIQLLLAQK